MSKIDTTHSYVNMIVPIERKKHLKWKKYNAFCEKLVVKVSNSRVITKLHLLCHKEFHRKNKTTIERIKKERQKANYYSFTKSLAKICDESVIITRTNKIWYTVLHCPLTVFGAFLFPLGIFAVLGKMAISFVEKDFSFLSFLPAIILALFSF